MMHRNYFVAKQIFSGSPPSDFWHLPYGRVLAAPIASHCSKLAKPAYTAIYSVIRIIAFPNYSLPAPAMQI